ncbi:hypothetical protein [Oligoflexus tunisiensis]|uniref:hypothetical protein n=1 Tax=Oligoflexus tunisiensis TaxID=708132 RepID=UPI00114C8540|nr:hypothetical protein [Oligoflexus tunisiensis]
MLGFFFILIALLSVGCDQFQQMKAQRPPALKIERVVRCNKYKTCIVVFANGTRGLMTSPKEGEYGCRSISHYSYIRCDGP